MDQVIEKRESRPRRARFTPWISVIVLLLVAGLPLYLDADATDVRQEMLSNSRWPTMTRVAHILW